MILEGIYNHNVAKVKRESMTGITNEALVWIMNGREGWKERERRKDCHYDKVKECTMGRESRRTESRRQGRH